MAEAKQSRGLPNDESFVNQNLAIKCGENPCNALNHCLSEKKRVLHIGSRR